MRDTFGGQIVSDSCPGQSFELAGEMEFADKVPVREVIQRGFFCKMQIQIILNIMYFFCDGGGVSAADSTDAQSNQIREIAMGEKFRAVSRIFLRLE